MFQTMMILINKSHYYDVENPNFVHELAYSISNGISNVRYRIRNYLRKYNIVVTELNRFNYYDIDTRMLYANFKLLREFVESEIHYLADDYDSKYNIENNVEYSKYKEKIKTLPTRVQKGIDNWFAYLSWCEDEIINERQRSAAITIDRLYRWWVFERENEQKSLEENYSCDLEMQLNDKDTTMLIELMKVREFLWT